jgi:hypothetical protein
MKRKILIFFLVLAMLPIISGAVMHIEMDVVEAQVESIQNNEEVLNVIIPISVKFTIDPFEAGGRGQIYSDVYWIENQNDVSVSMTFVGIGLTFANDTDFEAVPFPFSGYDSGLKSIYLKMEFGWNSTPPIIFTDVGNFNEVTMELGAYLDSSYLLPFWFTGTINPNPAVNWQAGDVKILLAYTLAYV